VEAARQEFVYGRGLTPAEVGEIAAMRHRMEMEIGAEDKTRLNIKQGHGGLVDVEFLVQMMALSHGHRHPELRVRNTIELLEALAGLNLLATPDAAILEDDYRFLSRLENRLRIESDQPSWAVPTSVIGLRPLARRMGFEGADGAARMLAELSQRRNRIRTIFDRYFTAAQMT
jgi:[glutamine synthetase] adenylyltransferase / [glutamine synthetase]-adenylyl-L-tyrosine phosphorylase